VIISPSLISVTALLPEVDVLDKYYIAVILASKEMPALGKR